METYTGKIVEQLSKTVTEKYTVAYRKTGHGPALVLIHGFPENGSIWDNLSKELSANYTLIIPDLPGAGESTFEGNDISIDELAESIKKILEKEGIKEYVVAGHSMGGYVALAFADKYPEGLLGLSLIHSVANADNEERKSIRRKSIELVEKGGKAQFIKQVIPGQFADTFKQQHPAVIEKQIQRGMLMEDASIIAFYKAMINRPDRIRILEESTFPVQFVIGEDDNIIPTDIAMQQATLPKINFISVYKDCGHMSMLENPGSLLKDIENFLSNCFKKNQVTL